MSINKFHSFLISTFGEKSQDVFELIDNDISLNISKIDEINDKNTQFTHIDKCKLHCKACKCRQDIPFWTGTIKKKIMLIAQDAGKGCENNMINCVFSLQDVVLNKEKYITDKHHPKHKQYFELFSSISSDFINKIYFTDIVKCSYSTDSSIKLSECECRVNIIDEISVVEPEIIILMGSPAKNTFLKVAKSKQKKIQLLKEVFEEINSKGKICFSEFLYNDSISIYHIPHFVGNLKIHSDYRKKFEKFEHECLLTIKTKENL